MIEKYFVVFTAFFRIWDYPQFQKLQKKNNNKKKKKKKKKKKQQNVLNIFPTFNWINRL